MHTTEAVEPGQVFVDLAKLIAQSRDNKSVAKCGNYDKTTKAPQISNNKVGGSDFFDDKNLIREETLNLFMKQIPTCLNIMLLPESCLQSDQCSNLAPVIERWTLQVVPRRTLKSGSTSDQFIDLTSLLRAIKSHLHFSYLGSMLMRMRDSQQPVSTICRIRIPGEMATNNQQYRSINLTDRRLFSPCLLNKSLILMVKVETQPAIEAVPLKGFLCSCPSRKIDLKKRHIRIADNNQSIIDKQSCSSYSDLDNESIEDGIIPEINDERPEQDGFLDGKKVICEFLEPGLDCLLDLDRKSEDLKLRSDKIDIQTAISAALKSDRISETTYDYPVLRYQSDFGLVPTVLPVIHCQSPTDDTQIETGLVKRPSDVKFFFPADDDSDESITPLPSPVWAPASTGEDATRAPLAPVSSDVKCRRALFGDDLVDEWCRRKSPVADDETEGGASVATKPVALLEEQRPRRSFVPSLFGGGSGIRKSLSGNKQQPPLDKSSAVFRFNRKTGLPLSSSPAPMTRNRSSFDFDSSLVVPHAIKKSLQSYDHDGASSDSDSSAGVPLCKSAPACTNLLGNFEECALNGRIKPFGIVDGFTLELGASGSFWPSKVTLPVTTLFFDISDDNAPSPYYGHCSLESIGRKGYFVPKKGTIQATLFNPQGTVVKMFIVRYDLTDMPPYCQTFVRQRTFFMPSAAPPEHAARHRSWLRYLIHLRFATSRSGKLYVHTDVRMLFSRKTEMDAYTNNDKSLSESVKFTPDRFLEPYELRSFTETPKNPKFSPRKCPQISPNSINLNCR